jgi:hypothetical protein
MNKPAKKTPPKKRQELENLLAEKILTQSAALKRATALLATKSDNKQKNLDFSRVSDVGKTMQTFP